MCQYAADHIVAEIVSIILSPLNGVLILFQPQDNISDSDIKTFCKYNIVNDAARNFT